ncbi:MAG: DJ-1/PfpI family protein [Clostridium perfringens]|nr:DJ-1/PfpI family protein [Clostridium perfringens]
MKKVLVLLAEGFEMVEGLSVVDVLVRAKVHCDTASIQSVKEVKSSHGVVVLADKLLDNVSLKDYDAVVLPGGIPGALNLRDDSRVIDLIKTYYNQGKIVAAICAGPIVLNKAQVLNGKDVTSHPSVKDEFINSNYIEDKKVVVCRNVITSRGAGTAFYFGLSILKELGYEEEAENIKKAIMLDFI